MRIEKIRLDKLKVPEKNVRLHTEIQLHEFERSIKMFGQIRPIVIDESNTILAGNGLYKALLDMGYDTADCYRVTGLTENQKKKLMIADNKVYSLGVDYLDTVMEFLHDLGDDRDVPGYDPDILEQMIGDAQTVTESIADYGVLGDENVQSIQNRAERREEAGIAPDTPAPAQPSPVLQNSNDSQLNQQNSPSGMADATPSSDEAPAEMRRFVICPNCGQKIYL